MDGHWSWSHMLHHVVGDGLHNKRRYWAYHAAIMSTKPPRSSRTFEEYDTFDVLSVIQAHSANHNRTDIVFNVYRSSGVKIEVNLSEDVSEMKGVKQVQNSIQLAHFSQKQWFNMIIYIKRRFHQQPHDRPRWICPLYSRGGGHDDLRTYQLCDKSRRSSGSPDGKT